MIEPITTAVQEIVINSNKLLHHTEADLIERRIPNVVKLVQYDDTLPVIAVDLKAGGVNYTLPSGAACNIRIRKPDDTIVYNPALGCDSTRSVVYFEVTAQIAAVVGELQTVLEVIMTGTVAGTSPLRIVVENNPVKVDDYESEDETKTIIAFVGEAEQARDEAVAAAAGTAEDAQTASAAATSASGSAATARSAATSAGSSATSAAGSATTAAGSATTAQQAATAASGSATSAGQSASAAATSAQEAAASAAMLDVEKILGNFADYEETTTASQEYKVGKLLTYNGYLYRVTTAIASGGTITPGTNCVQTTVGDEVANNCLRFENVTVSATTGDIATITDARITADHVVAECVWGDALAITTDVTCTTSAGSLVLNGTCTSATTVTVTLVKKCN